MQAVLALRDKGREPNRTAVAANYRRSLHAHPATSRRLPEDVVDPDAWPIERTRRPAIKPQMGLTMSERVTEKAVAKECNHG